MTDLKPCPLCGGEATMELADVDSVDTYYQVGCHRCQMYIFRGEGDMLGIEDCDYCEEEEANVLDYPYETVVRTIQRELAEMWNRLWDKKVGA